MIRNSRVLVVSFFLILALGASFADTSTVLGMGNCDNTNFCSGPGAGTFSSYNAQNSSLRDFFVVDLAGVGNITSATFNIWDIGGNDPLLNLYAATGLTYTGLGSGPVIASGNVPQLPQGSDQYISFTLNADGLAALNAARLIVDGSGHAYFTFGGDLPDPGTSAFLNGFDSNNLPFLDFTVGSINQTPEPASLALLGSGLLGASFTWRKRFTR